MSEIGSREAAVLQVIGNRRIDSRELADAAGLTAGQLRTVLTTLATAGLVVRHGGMWEVTNG